MDVQFGPNAVDEPNLLYKLQRKIKVFNTSSTLSNRGYNLVSSSGKYAIVFVGSPDGFLSVYHLKELVDKECEPKHVAVKLSEKPTHISVSCDEDLLAVTGGQLLTVYKVADFQNVNVAPVASIRLDTNAATFVSSLQWNPCIPDNVAIAYFDGTLLVATVTTSLVKKVQSKARCLCWSPKGKQLVTGNSDGSLCQFKPDLTLAKNIPAPNLFEGAPIEALAIHWISTFQFAVVFRNASNGSRPCVTLVNTPKGGQPVCLNYEDVCYSMGSSRPWYYYLQGLAQWNMILASSSNSMEIATLGSADGANWLQWCPTDEARPELPLTDKKKENYPVGVCIDTCSIHQLPWGENETLPFMPLLLVVSQSGLLTIFNIINLNKDAPQICTPPQQLQLIALPQAALTSDIPDDAPAQVTMTLPASAAAKPQSKPSQPFQVPQPVQIPQPAQQQATANSGGTNNFAFSQSSAVTMGMPQMPPSTTLPPAQMIARSTVPAAQPFESKQEMKPATTVPPPTAAPQTKSVPQSQPTKPQLPAPEVNAALKAEQERVSKLKADQELRNMLVKEVNDFQMELYNFVVGSRETQIKLQQDLNSIDANFNFQSLNAEQLKKDCNLEDLRSAVVQLKLDLVRACAVVAEARTHADAKDQHQWSQVDPLTTKRVASVKKLAYYVQTQLDQAHRALDFKWNEMIANDPQLNKPGQRMIRPILDDVYQPLVKQQEILSRQQAVLRTLRNTLKECESTSLLKTTSLLRTPFRNKDPLSKLTKNILNMSIEPQSKPKENLLTPQKLDALKDMLSNHKPTKVKPVNVELRQHLAQMRINYEKSVKEKANMPEPQQQPVKTQTAPFKVEPKFNPPVSYETVQSVHPATAMQHVTGQEPIHIPMKPQVNISNTSSFTPVNNLKLNVPSTTGMPNVARTLFSEDKPAFTTKQPQASMPLMFGAQTTPSFGFPSFSNSTTATTNARSMLKDMLQNKQANIEANSDSNTFMGQPICSPSAFSSTPPQSQPVMAFSSTPISGMNNMFNKSSPPATEFKPQPTVAKAQSSETGESDVMTIKPVQIKKEEKPLKPLPKQPQATSTPNIPDIVKSNNKAYTVPVTNQTEAKSDRSASDTENVVPISTANKPCTPAVVQEDKSKVDKKSEIQKSTKSDEPTISTASSIFAAANTGSPSEKPSIFGSLDVKTASQGQSPVEVTTSATSLIKTSTVTSTTASASSVFASAAASQPFGKTTQPGSIFSSILTTSSNAFGATQSSIFGSAATAATTTQATTVSAVTTQSVFSASESKPVLFSTPTPSSPTATQVLATTSQPLFGTSVGSLFSTAAPTSQSDAALGSSPASDITVTTTATSAFGTPSTIKESTTAAAQSAASPTPITTTQSEPIEAAPVSTTAQSVFDTATTTVTQSLFGTATSPSAKSLFASAAATNAASVFGATTTTAQSLFGTNATTSAQSVFGATASVTPQSVFGATATSTAQSIFGGATTTTQSVFGSTSTPSLFGTASTQSSVFGSQTTSSPSVFGSSTQTSIFGSGATSQASIFGGTQTSDSVFAGTTQASVFGSTPTTQTSVFGSPTQTTQSSVFGTQPASEAAGASVFGGAENLFAAASISTTNASSPASAGSIFGGGSSGSVFGGGGASSNTNIFGGKAAFSQSNPQAAAIFGGANAFGQKPPSNNNFWSGASNTGGGFGSAGFGQQPTTQASSIFGAGGGSFSAPSTGPAFGSPQQQQQTSVFGSPQQQPGTGFGGSAVFGGKPAFGQSTAFGSPTSGGGFGSFGGFNKSPGSGFGSAATFGGGASFGGGGAFGGTSPGKAFGGSAPAPNFATNQSNATFESLATQNTLTFGNLAQQSPPPSQQPAPSFNTSPSFTGWRGG